MTQPFDSHAHPLGAHETRVLATLMEKSRTVPDSYPLTLNSLVAGCNQKSSRDPVMQLTEGEVQDALDHLRQRALVVEIGGARVARWEHNFARGVGVPDQSAVLLALMALRGPQTAGELRINSERWHRFADISSVEAFLHELAERSDDKGGPLVTLLARAPGAREARWAHLLGGPVQAPMQSHAAAGLAEAAANDEGLHARVQALESQVARLHASVAELCAQLGVSAP